MTDNRPPHEFRDLPDEDTMPLPIPVVAPASPDAPAEGDDLEPTA